jgi:membrane-bound lytic murein transglycosylase D
MINKASASIILSLFLLNGCTTTQTQPEKTKVSKLSAPQLIDESLCTLAPDEHQLYSVADHGNLWQRVREGYGFPEQDNPRIDTYVNWYSRNQLYMDRVTERGQRYLHYIVSQLEANDMPLELAMLPIVESAFDPFAYSHGRASGIWQFIPGTGRHFGLKQNWWYDGRRDIVASTDAAILYLKRLHAQFDEDWLLALAAYNTGQGNLQRAINRNRQAGLPTDYWSLRLPRETRNYVPQLLALSRVVADPEQYGLTLNPIPDEPYFAQVDIGSQIDLAQAAALADIDMDELYLLNPAFNRWATDPEGPHRLLVPAGRAEHFTTQLASVPERERIGWERYQIVAGDSLISIARRHNTSVEALRSANNLNSNTIRQGQTLLIPRATQPAQSYAFSADQRLERRQQNSQGQEGSTRIYHEVRAGDSFWRIANQYQVSISALTRWNGMAPNDTLRPGQRLVVWTKAPEQQQASQQLASREAVTRRINYRVRQGDSLARIASRFNLSVNDILRWNSVSRDSYIHPGQSLTLYVDVTQINN